MTHSNTTSILSLDYETMGVFDHQYAGSHICENAGSYRHRLEETRKKANWSHRDFWQQPWHIRTITPKSSGYSIKYRSINYKPDVAKYAAQNALKDHDMVVANREEAAIWTVNQTNQVSNCIWLGQNFRWHDWNYIKSLGVYDNESSGNNGQPAARPPIIDSLELSLLIQPDARCVSLRKNYKGKEQAEIKENSGQDDKSTSDSGNDPAKDAEECYKYTFDKSQFCKGDEKDGGLVELIHNHPLKPILDFILCRDAPGMDWMKRDWESVNRFAPNDCNGNRKIGCDRLKGFLCKTNKSFRRLFKSYLKTSPFACAYFVCWLARAKGLNEIVKNGSSGGSKYWSEANGIFAPHPWIAGQYPQVLHLIRTYQWDLLKKTDTEIDCDDSESCKMREGCTSVAKSLNGWYHEFSERAKGNNYTLKGRYVEVPAGLEHDHYTCPRFPATVLADTAPLNPPERQHNRCRESLECHLESLCEDCKSFHGIHQADVMGRILGFDTKDQSQRRDPEGFTWKFSPSGLYVAPTGFGKSMCYQLPAYIFAKRWKALTVVISPLQALQADQVWGMQRENPRIHVLNEIGEKESNTDETIATETTGAQLATSAKKTDVSDPSFFSIAYYNSTLTSSQKSHIRAAVRGGDCDVIFLAPEQLMNAAVRDMLNCRDIAQVVLDEAHCLSSWGHSFRPSYMYVARWLNDFCEKRLKALGIKTKSPEIALGTDKLTNLSFHHKDTITDHSHSTTLPVPRAALFTATIEPAQTEDVKTLFAIDSKDIIGGFSLRPEIELEVHDNALAVPETIQYHSKTKLDHFAFRTGVLHGFLSQEFINNIRFADLPVLVYSVTIRQSELVFGKTHFRPKRISNGKEVYSENLDYGLSQLTGAVNDHLIDIDLKQFAKYEISQIIDEKLNIISFPILESPPTTLQQLIGIIRGIHLLPKTDQKGNRIPFVEAISLTLKRQNNGEVTLRVRPPKNLETLPADTYFHGKVALYHGKMPSHQRKNVMDTFCSGDKNAPNIILCTNAFGLGVDKGDICSVILLGLPTSINELVQQTGRAHRNPAAVIEAAGKDQNRNAPKARAILLTDRMKDVHINEFLLKSNHMSSGTLEQIWYLLHAQWTRRMEMVKRIATGNEEIPQNSNYKEISPEGIIVVDSRTLSSVLNSDQQLDDDQRRTKVDICLYWLERLGLVRRIQDLWESEAYKLPDNDPINTKTPDGKPTELTKLQEDLETIKVWYYLHRLNAKTGLHLPPERFQEALISLDPSLFVGTCFSLEVINKWREEIREEIRKQNLGEAIDAMRDSKTNAKYTWGKVCKFTIEKLKKLNPTKVNGSPQSKDDF
ncbi:MAG: helicase-related protein, partial [Opitutales bacterium]|nr:helicase-related protein [Opitutales bacterium]